MTNNQLTTITVTYNNGRCLNRTLLSLLRAHTKPFEIIVIDGGSTDNTVEIIQNFIGLLPITFFSEPDNGIYDAMNKGRQKAKTQLVHYLNAGDFISGDPYFNVSTPCILPVQIADYQTGRTWFDFIKLNGFGYCHQGIIFKSNHKPYNLSYSLGADFDLILNSFSDGLHKLTKQNTGVVHYNLDGVSSRSLPIKGIVEILNSAWRALPLYKCFIIFLILFGKSFIPRGARRFFAFFVWNK